MGRYIYEAMVCVDDEGMYYAYVPDLPECQAEGESYGDVVFSLAERLEEMLCALLCDGRELPVSRYGHRIYDGFMLVTLVVSADDSHNYEVVSAAEAADMLGVSRPRVSKMLESGVLRGYREGRNSWVYVRSIEDRLRYFPNKHLEQDAYADEDAALEPDTYTGASLVPDTCSGASLAPDAYTGASLVPDAYTGASLAQDADAKNPASLGYASYEASDSYEENEAFWEQSSSYCEDSYEEGSTPLENR